MLAPTLIGALVMVTPARSVHAQFPAIALWRDAESGVDIRLTREASGRLTGMRAGAADTWDDGSIYDARSGKTYKASMRLTHPDTLKVKGDVQLGVVKLGRTASWVRIPDASGAR